MCMDVRKICECGRHKVQFHLRDNVLLPEVISRLFCPECAGPENFKAESMVNDNGWIIEYDIVLAKMMIAQKMMIDVEEIEPGFIFDEGYACWQEMYPGEQEEIKKEKSEIIAILKEDQSRYLAAIQSWNIKRITDLKSKGWRKVQRA